MGFVASSTYNFTYGEFLVDHKKIKQDIDDFEKDLKVLRDSLLVIGAIDYSKDRVQNSYDKNRLLDKSFTLAQSYKDIEYLKARYSAFMRFFPYSILPTVMPQREALMIRKYFMEESLTQRSQDISELPKQRSWKSVMPIEISMKIMNPKVL